MHHTRKAEAEDAFDANRGCPGREREHRPNAVAATITPGERLLQPVQDRISQAKLANELGRITQH